MSSTRTRLSTSLRIVCLALLACSSVALRAPIRPGCSSSKQSPTSRRSVLATFASFGAAAVVGTQPAFAKEKAAAKAKREAAAKERKEEAQVTIFKKIFKAMDADEDGKVEMADVVEKVAAGTAQLSHRAQAARPDGAVALQLPMVFSLDEWLKEVRSRHRRP